MELVTLVVAFALLEYVFFTMKIGSVRQKYEIKAPAITGHDIFERYFRVHQNTLENLVVFIPSIYGFAYYINAHWAAGIGVFFLIGRILYFRGYTDPQKNRSIGFGLTFISENILLLGTIVGCILKLIK